MHARLSLLTTLAPSIIGGEESRWYMCVQVCMYVCMYVLVCTSIKATRATHAPRDPQSWARSSGKMKDKTERIPM